MHRKQSITIYNKYLSQILSIGICVSQYSNGVCSLFLTFLDIDYYL
jgi:hypothetical protein